MEVNMGKDKKFIMIRLCVCVNENAKKCIIFLKCVNTDKSTLF